MFGDFLIDEVEVPYSVAREIESRGRYGELLVRNFEEGRLMLGI